jgi:hypothetical protein
VHHALFECGGQLADDFQCRFGFIESENGANVGMVEGSRCPRLALEAGDFFGPGGNGKRQELAFLPAFWQINQKAKGISRSSNYQIMIN